MNVWKQVEYHTHTYFIHLFLIIFFSPIQQFSHFCELNRKIGQNGVFMCSVIQIEKCLL